MTDSRYKAHYKNNQYLIPWSKKQLLLYHAENREIYYTICTVDKAGLTVFVTPRNSTIPNWMAQYRPSQTSN